MGERDEKVVAGAASMETMVTVQFRVYHEKELNDEKWYWLEA